MDGSPSRSSAPWRAMQPAPAHLSAGGDVIGYQLLQPFHVGLVLSQDRFDEDDRLPVVVSPQPRQQLLDRPHQVSACSFLRALAARLAAFTFSRFSRFHLARLSSPDGGDTAGVTTARGAGATTSTGLLRGDASGAT